MAKSQNSDSGNKNIPVKVVCEITLIGYELRPRRIAVKAYELYPCQGHDLNDRLEVEQMVLSELAASTSGNPQNPRPKGPRAIER